jgi:hypothetical protein
MRNGGQIDVAILPDKAAGLEHVAKKVREFLDRNWSILISFRQNISKFGLNHPIHAALARQGVPRSNIANGGPASNLISITTPTRTGTTAPTSSNSSTSP